MVVKGKLPTLEVASVRLLRVVDLPEEGLPTRAIRGSRGIVRTRRNGRDVRVWQDLVGDRGLVGSGLAVGLGSRVHFSCGIMFVWRDISRTTGTRGGLATLMRCGQWGDLVFRVEARRKFVIDKDLDLLDSSSGDDAGLFASAQE